MTGSLHQILNITRSGMVTQMLNLDVISNNLANVNTTAFKQSRANFQEILDAQSGLSGTQLRSTTFLMEQGNIKYSSSPLDVAIEGEGFFMVTTADGETGYTRDGHFMLDEDENIVTAGGQRLQWTGTLPADAEDILISADGTVSVRQGDIWNEIGSIALARFPNATALTESGGNIWLESEVSGAAEVGTPGSDGFGSLLGYALEQSNVDYADQMARMITLQRGFEMSIQSFQQTDQMIALAISMRQG
ncbi:MAG: flagellar hook basal-body protein [Anaerolineales bacterium]|nr:flagellar hook basal-body protein [Anaerolineales bacterium]